jgi:hypothetical protein
MAKQYTNRTDLQNKAGKIAKAAAKGQTYGQAGQQLQAQAAVPMAKPPTETAQPPRQFAMPGTLGAFGRPTERPNEPITAGAPFGPGATPLQAGTLPRMSTETSTLEQIKAIYAAYPNDDLANLIDSYTREGF